MPRVILKYGSLWCNPVNVGQVCCCDARDWISGVCDVSANGPHLSKCSNSDSQLERGHAMHLLAARYSPKSTVVERRQ